MKKFNMKALVAALAMTGAASAFASGSAMSNMTNTAVIANSCTITAQGFSTVYNPQAGTDTTPNGSVTYQCTNSGSAASIALSAGNGTFAQRLLEDGSGDQLNYNLFYGSVSGSVWGDGSGSTVEDTSLTQDGTVHTVTVYGDIPHSQAQPVGTYTDTVVATINF
jgi:spore coat protein U-like protein